MFLRHVNNTASLNKYAHLVVIVLKALPTNTTIHCTFFCIVVIFSFGIEKEEALGRFTLDREPIG